MAKEILAVGVIASTPQYRLPEADRQAILARTPGDIRRREIERKRKEFMAINNGCAFGEKPIKTANSSCLPPAKIAIFPA